MYFEHYILNIYIYIFFQQIYIYIYLLKRSSLLKAFYLLLNRPYFMH